MRSLLNPRFVALSLVMAMLFAACANGDPAADVASPTDPTPTATTSIPSLVPQPSPTPFVVPTIVANPTATVGATDPTATPTVATGPTSTPRPIPTTVPTVAPTAAPTATPRPVLPTATAVPPTPAPTSGWVNPDCYVGPGAADEPAWWCGGKLCWRNAPHHGCPTTPPVYPNIEVGCTISDRTIVVNEIITLKAFQDPVNVPLVFVFDHGDGTLDRTAESRAFYEAPGRYEVVMRWNYGLQNGRIFCGTVVVTGTAGPTPTPTATPTVQIGCTVSNRHIVVGQVITLRATQDPANIPVAYVFEHGDGTLDSTSQSQAYYQTPGTYTVRLQWAHSGRSGVIGCGTVTVSPDVNLGAYLGLTAGQAEARAATQGLTMRIVRIDAESFPGTTDYRLDRVNIEIDAGLVTKAYLG